MLVHNKKNSVNSAVKNLVDKCASELQNCNIKCHREYYNAQQRKFFVTNTSLGAKYSEFEYITSYIICVIQDRYYRLQCCYFSFYYGEMFSRCCMLSEICFFCVLEKISKFDKRENSKKINIAGGIEAERTS